MPELKLNALKSVRCLKSESCVALLVVVLFSGALMLCASGEPSLPGDTLKFQFVGRYGGIVHPPGSPLYMLLLWAASSLPLSTPAGAANALSALGGAAALGFLYYALHLLGARPWARWSALLLLASSGHFFRQSTTAEVYAWHLAFQSATLCFAVAWSVSKKRRALWGFCLSYSVGFGVHGSMLTMLPAVLYWLFAQSPRGNRLRWLFPALASVLVGTAMYAYLPLRSLADPLYQEANIADLDSFIWYVTGGYFKGRFFGVPLLGIFADRIPKLGLWLLLSGPLALTLLGLASFKSGLGNRPALFRFLLLLVFGRTLFVVTYRIPDIDEYYTPLALYFALAAGCELERLAANFPRFAARPWLVLAGAMTTMFVSLGHAAFETMRWRDKAQLQELRHALGSLNEPALLLSSTYEQTAALCYLVYGEALGEGRFLPVHLWDEQILSEFLRGERVDWHSYLRLEPQLDTPMFYRMRSRDSNNLWLLPLSPRLSTPKATLLLVDERRAQELERLPVNRERTLEVGNARWISFRVSAHGTGR